MLKRAQLVSRWQSKLDENRRLFLDGSPRLRWLRHMQIRLFRFLVSNYGGDELTTQGKSSTSESPNTELDNATGINFGLTDLTCDREGSPPKSNVAIRATLKSLHGANDESAERGPLVHGLGKSDWIIVETYRHRGDVCDYCERLRQHHIRFRYSTSQNGKRFMISVQMCDKDRAESLLVARRQTAPQELRLERAAAMSRTIKKTVAIAALLGMFVLVMAGIVEHVVWNVHPVTAATPTILSFLLACVAMYVWQARLR